MWYFAYGMNCSLEGMQHRCPGAVSYGVAILPDFELCFRYHADIQVSGGKDLYGVLWDIHEHDLDALDQLEGYPFYYDRHQVTVWHDGVARTAWVYQMIDQCEEAEPDQGYFDICRRGYSDNGVPVEQLDSALKRLLLAINN